MGSPLTQALIDSQEVSKSAKVFCWLAPAKGRESSTTNYIIQLYSPLFYAGVAQLGRAVDQGKRFLPWADAVNPLVDGSSPFAGANNTAISVDSRNELFLKSERVHVHKWKLTLSIASHISWNYRKSSRDLMTRLFPCLDSLARRQGASIHRYPLGRHEKSL